MHKGDGLIGDACVPQPLVDKGRLFAGADDAHVGRLVLQHLHLRLEIVLVAVGHDNHIVLRLHSEVVADAGEVAADDLVRLGKPLPRGKLGAVVKNHRSKPHTAQQRHQCLGDVPRAKDQRPLSDGQLHCKAFCLNSIFIHQIGHGPVQRLHQPAHRAGTDPPQHLRRQCIPRPIAAGNTAEVDGHIAAADHTGALLAAIAAQPELPRHAVGTVSQHLPGDGNGPPLHGAAADGTGQQTVAAHQHLAARTSGRGSVVPDDGGQHRVLSLLPLVPQRLKNGIHRVYLLPYQRLFTDTLRRKAAGRPLFAMVSDQAA